MGRSWARILAMIGERRSESRGPIPAPVPTVLIDPPRPVRVLDGDGRPVRVTDRGAVPMPPAQFAFDDGSPTIAITSWAGPWPVDERWWDPASARQVARFQLVDVQGRAYLVSCEMDADHGPRWQLVACYD